MVVLMVGHMLVEHMWELVSLASSLLGSLLLLLSSLSALCLSLSFSLVQ